MPRKSQTLHMNPAQCVEHKRILNQTPFINSYGYETLIARRRYDVQGVLIACAIFGMEVFGSLPPTEKPPPLFGPKPAISTVFPNRLCMLTMISSVYMK